MNDIDRLKELLFGNEKKALDAITRRLEGPESRTADISDVLPEAILSSHAADRRLVRALEEPVEECIRHSIRRDPQDFANALFPVIGPAIRKSIAEALRALTQSLNRTIENSLSVRTRIEAWRAGAPLGEYILQRNLVYRVEQVFLIKRADGLLIEHVHHDGAISKDTDAVSAMFTAIQDFIQDSFTQETGQSLTTAVLGDLTLWAIHGPHAILVCVIRGVAPSSVRSDLTMIIEDIHLKYGDALARYDGGRGVAGVDIELEKCLILERREQQATAKKSPIGAIILFAVIVALLLWWIGVRYADALKLENFRLALESTPGIVVNELRRENGHVVLRGLRDPLSGSPAEIAPGSHIDPAKLKLELAPYQSLDGPIVERRARRILKPPPGVGLNLDGQSLKLTGSASAQWKQNAQLIGAAIPGVNIIDLSAMNLSDAEILAAATAELDPPETLELSVHQGVLHGNGTASVAWMDLAARVAPAITGVKTIDLRQVVPDELQVLQSLLQRVDGTELFFARNETFRAGEDRRMDELAALLLRIGDTSARLGYDPEIVLIGHSDGTDTVQANEIVESARAEQVASWLIRAGVSPEWIETRRAPLAQKASRENPASRKVQVRVGVNTDTGVN